MDPFQRAVDDARRRLGISVSEMLRRAGFPRYAAKTHQRQQGEKPLTISGARYHLEPRYNKDRQGGHRVHPELITRLADVLEISEEELRRAAQLAAGFTVPMEPIAEDIPTMFARFLGDERVTEEEKQQAAARLLQIIAEQSLKRRPDQRLP